VRRVAKTGEPVLTTNAQEDPRFEQQKSVVAHNLRSILCVPLKLKEEIIGVIFLDSRVHSGLFEKNDLRILTAFADQAAVAIENARMFEELQRANAELRDAYDATLRGWALTLELRDKETEGHTQRVTYLTKVLAKKLGITGEDLEHIERGALLHDIGKMAIPDYILLKRGALTLAERKFMELHPEFAKDLLEKIEYLHPAIDIPYCHHEKWDGSGYPQNLRGEEIPFAARIFAVVDVWDALTSERPYREPLAPEKVRQIIRAESGKHFDPRVVAAFLAIEDLPVSPRIGEIRPV
jgi:putative nucleotidyltransferase with HDIG domain